MPNKLSQFWQELKRRKVLQVITVYAATAFVILELVDIVAPNLGLPTWTFNLILIILVVGFVIAVILSWIYDIHPEGGIIKTEPAHKVKAGNIPKSSINWKITSYIAFMVIMGLIVLNVIPDSGKKEILDKSIAVLPFRNDSPDQDRMYFINGTMEAILDNLCKIKDLRVPGRTSVEQYRDNPKPIPTVAEEMNVSYVLEGSGHRDGNNVRLVVQLLDGKKDQHLWSKTYDADIEEIFTLQSEIAQLIAAEIEAIITPEEKELIDKIPTTNLTAFDFYQKGEEEYGKYSPEDSLALERAEDLYQYAIEYDSTFAKAYIGLAKVYWRKYYGETYFSEGFLDSVLFLADIALSYDDQLADAFTLKGRYYNAKGKEELAIEEFNKALKYNPNDWIAFQGKGYLYADSDLVKSIDNLQKAASIYRGPGLPDLLRGISNSYLNAGLIERATFYNYEAFKLDGDTLAYYYRLILTEFQLGNYEKMLEFAIKGNSIDTNSNNYCYALGVAYLFLEQYEESLKYISKAIELGQVPIGGYDAIGGLFWINGYKEEAGYYLNKQIELCTRRIELGRSYSDSYYDLASVFAFRGEKENAYENLRNFMQRPIITLWSVTLIKNEFLFDSLRGEPEFQQIVEEMEAKYQTEHERVRKWLEENDML